MEKSFFFFLTNIYNEEMKYLEEWAEFYFPTVSCTGPSLFYFHG